jgi:hypothetical protein
MKDKQDKELNIFLKSFTALFRFVKFVMIDTIAKFVVLLVTATRDLFKWAIKVNKEGE